MPCVYQEQAQLDFNLQANLVPQNPERGRAVTRWWGSWEKAPRSQERGADGDSPTPQESHPATM